MYKFVKDLWWPPILMLVGIACYERTQPVPNYLMVMEITLLYIFIWIVLVSVIVMKFLDTAEDQRKSIGDNLKLFLATRFLDHLFKRFKNPDATTGQKKKPAPKKKKAVERTPVKPTSKNPKNILNTTI